MNFQRGKQQAESTHDDGGIIMSYKIQNSTVKLDIYIYIYQDLKQYYKLPENNTTNTNFDA